MIRPGWSLFLAGTVWLSLPAIARCQAPPAEDAPVNKELIESALKLTKEAAGRYAFVLQQPDRSEAKLLSEPLLRWSNPAAGEIHGNVFLWTVQGRPAVVGSLFKWFTPHTHMSHEFYSLAEMPLKGSYEGRQIWSTREAGVRFTSLEGAAPPASSATQRLLQMRRFARDFGATKLQRDGEQQELRLLPQPIYRYSAPQEGVQDGALFVFVQGTDPEVFLLLEARGEADSADSPQWMFAAARMNSVGFTLRYQQREVWAVEIMPSSDVYSHAETYTSFMHRTP
jgi:hypothetical protein